MLANRLRYEAAPVTGVSTDGLAPEGCSRDIAQSQETGDRRGRTMKNPEAVVVMADSSENQNAVRRFPWQSTTGRESARPANARDETARPIRAKRRTTRASLLAAAHETALRSGTKQARLPSIDHKVVAAGNLRCEVRQDFVPDSRVTSTLQCQAALLQHRRALRPTSARVGNEPGSGCLWELSIQEPAGCNT